MKQLFTGTQIEQADFIRTFGAMQHAAFEINVANGWWSDRNTITESGLPGAVPIVVTGCLGLVATEVSEAIEAVRKTPETEWGSLAKDSLVRELAGTVVRCMDLAERLELPLSDAIIAEIEANAERGFRHGGKAA